MGLFQHKQSSAGASDDSAPDSEQHFFDEYFREELRNHGRWYFEKIISENGTLFKKELDATLENLNTELKAHLTEQLNKTVAQVGEQLKDHVNKQVDEQFAEHSKTLQDAQNAALDSINQSVESLKSQQNELTETLKKNVADQEAMVKGAFEENATQLAKVKDAQNAALDSINQSVESLKHQHKELADTLEKNVATQEEMLVTTFQSNMAQVIEHYLLGALGDQYDLKAQLPGIIQQMEDNKQAIVDDMKL